MGKQINALTSTRGIAALMVVIFHFSGGTFPFNKFPTFFYHGALAVSYFFVLSGFVLYNAYEGKNITYGDYIKRRIARIVPVYELALLLIICANYFIYKNPFSGAYAQMITIHALLLQAYIPDYAMNLNLPGWTLSVELFFYLSFPLLLIICKNHPRFFVVLTIVLYAATQAVHLHYYPLRHNMSSNIIDTVFFNPVIHVNQFMIGMCGGYLFRKMILTSKMKMILLAVSTAAVLLLMNFLPPAVSCHTGLIAPVFMLFIVSVSMNDSRILNVRPLVFLGEISYGIYILQLPVHDFALFFNNKYMHLPDGYFFYCFVGILIIASSVSFIFFEKPLRERINSFTPRLQDKRTIRN